MDGAVNKATLSSRETGESAVKSSGFGPDPRGPTRGRATSHSKRPRGRKPQETCEMWAIWVDAGKAVLSKISRPGVETRMLWLPGMDSNHDSRLQRPLSYH